MFFLLLATFTFAREVARPLCAFTNYYQPAGCFCVGGIANAGSGSPFLWFGLARSRARLSRCRVVLAATGACITQYGGRSFSYGAGVGARPELVGSDLFSCVGNANGNFSVFEFAAYGFAAYCGTPIGMSVHKKDVCMFLNSSQTNRKGFCNHERDVEPCCSIANCAECAFPPTQLLGLCLKNATATATTATIVTTSGTTTTTTMTTTTKSTTAQTATTTSGTTTTSATTSLVSTPTTLTASSLSSSLDIALVLAVVALVVLVLLVVVGIVVMTSLSRRLKRLERGDQPRELSSSNSSPTTPTTTTSSNIYTRPPASSFDTGSRYEAPSAQLKT